MTTSPRAAGKAPAHPEAWLRGPVEGVPAPLQPVAHSLVQALEDVERLAADLTPGDLWRSPGGAATVGFHLRHMAGSLDRLLTYARGEMLSEAQRRFLALEKEPTPGVGAETLVADLRGAIERGLEQLRRTDPATLQEERRVGRAGLPATALGLLYHAGEHLTRHAGQISTTVRVLRGMGSERNP